MTYLSAVVRGVEYFRFVLARPGGRRWEGRKLLVMMSARDARPREKDSLQRQWERGVLVPIVKATWKHTGGGPPYRLKTPVAHAAQTLKGALSSHIEEMEKMGV